MPTLSPNEFMLVYNMFSLTIAAMFASFVFFVLARQQLSTKYRPAMIMSSLVVAIAGYHYFRIFNSWDGAYQLRDGAYVATGAVFNDAYRYVDWLLTVPLLVAELVAVLALSKAKRGPLMAKLIIASAAMIALGYPGEVSLTTGPRALWGTLSTIPFLYILFVLWGELGKAAENNSDQVKTLLRNTKLLLIGTWGFYPIAYMLPMAGIEGSTASVGLQVGYTIADITAKCGYGIMIYHIAKAKMEADGSGVAEGLSAELAS